MLFNQQHFPRINKCTVLDLIQIDPAGYLFATCITAVPMYGVESDRLICINQDMHHLPDQIIDDDTDMTRLSSARA